MVGQISVITQQVQEVVTPIKEFGAWRHCVLKEDGIIPTTCKWAIGGIIQVYPGKDGFVRVATVKTVKGVYKRPANKIALLLPENLTSLVYLVIVTFIRIPHSSDHPVLAGRMLAPMCIIMQSYNHCYDRIVYN